MKNIENKTPGVADWFATRTGEKVLGALEYAHSERDIAIVYGGAGLGKTRTIRHYQASNQNVWVATMSPDAASSAAALEEVYEAKGANNPPSGAARMRRLLVSDLRGTDGLLVIDEAQHLSVSGLETFRAIYDAAGIGLVFCGNEAVYSRLNGGSRSATFAQIFSRVGYRLYLPRPLKSDAEVIAAAWSITGSKELALLAKISRTPGALRGMVKVLNLARTIALAEEKAIALEHIQGAWQRLGGEL